MSAKYILGLDVGGANLKAATTAKQSVSVPFPLWKERDRLSAALRELIERFPETDAFALTMTGELCDCYETSAQGVKHIVESVQGAARSFPVHVWSTAGKFVPPNEAIAKPEFVAAANWHATASFAGRYVTRGLGLLIDIGSTTTDLIPIVDGEVLTHGRTDVTRLVHGELIYTGVGRTPAAMLLPPGRYAAELFATTLDAYLVMGQIAEQGDNLNTADGRPATRDHAHGRLARMLGGDRIITTPEATESLAQIIIEAQWNLLHTATQRATNSLREHRIATLDPDKCIAITCGSGDFLACRLAATMQPAFTDVLSLSDVIGHDLAASAPAYAVAVLALEGSL